MHLVDGLGRQADATVARVEETLVEGVEVMGTQLPQPDPAESGKHMTFDVPAGAVVGHDRALALVKMGSASPKNRATPRWSSSVGGRSAGQRTPR